MAAAAKAAAAKADAGEAAGIASSRVEALRHAPPMPPPPPPPPGRLQSPPLPPAEVLQEVLREEAEAAALRAHAEAAQGIIEARVTAAHDTSKVASLLLHAETPPVELLRMAAMELLPDALVPAAAAVGRGTLESAAVGDGGSGGGGGDELAIASDTDGIWGGAGAPPTTLAMRLRVWDEESGRVATSSPLCIAQAYVAQRSRGGGSSAFSAATSAATSVATLLSIPTAVTSPAASSSWHSCAAPDAAAVDDVAATLHGLKRADGGTVSMVFEWSGGGGGAAPRPTDSLLPPAVVL